MEMSSDDRRVDHQPLQIEVLQGFEDSLPYALLGPAIEPLEHAVPRAKSLGQIPPRSTRPHDPQHRIEEQPAVHSRPSRIAFLSRQQPLDPHPLLVRQLKSPHRHPPSLRFTRKTGGI